MITPNGVKLNNEKVKAVQEYQQPKLAQEIKAFLGLVVISIGTTSETWEC